MRCQPVPPTAADWCMRLTLQGMAKGARAGRAAVASVEGRNVTIQH